MSTTVRSTNLPMAESPQANWPPLEPGARGPGRAKNEPNRVARGLRALGMLAGLVMIAWGGVAWLGREEAGPVEITATVTRGELPVMVTERGDLESSKTVEVRCEVEGEQIKITETIPEGVRVTAGQVVIRFDTEKLSRSHAEQEVKWRTAEAKANAAAEDWEVAKNKAESEMAKSQLSLRLADIDLRKYLEGEYVQDKRNIDGEILLAEEELRRAEERVEFSERLNKKGFVSASEVESDRVAVTKSKNTRDVAKEKLRVLEIFSHERQVAELTANAEEAKRELERTRRSQASAMAKAESEHRGAAATVAIEKAQLDKIKQQLDGCEVKAPQDGILVYDKSRPWDTSGRIQPGGIVHFQRTLFSLPDLAQMQVKVKIHESAVKKVEKGQEAEIRVDALPGSVLHGTVEKVATLAEFRGYWDQRGVKEYETIVKVRDVPPDAGLKPGMTAEVRILAKHLSDVLLVPVQSVAEQEGEHFSFVLSGKSIERRVVAIGEHNDKFVEVKSGLHEHEHVLLDARARIAAETKGNENGAATKKPRDREPPSPAGDATSHADR